MKISYLMTLVVSPKNPCNRRGFYFCQSQLGFLCPNKIWCYNNHHQSSVNLSFFSQSNKLMRIFVAIFTIAAISACTKTPTYQKLEGQTMGTSYHITFEVPKNLAVSDVQNSIEKRLAQINASMSTYDKNSTISKFNTLPAGQTIQIDSDFIKVLDDSRTIYDKSGHAFDPTVYPLVELWGFGSKMSAERLQNPPSDDNINATKDKVGLDKITLNGNQLSKTADGVGLDFSAIAKGYGVDVIAGVLKNDYKINNYMVEIGGEVATSGLNHKGKSWTLAIDAPIMGSTVSTRQIATTVSAPSGQPLHIATSGNYRNMLRYGDHMYSHTINPTSAQPVQNSAPSVSVIHHSVALADGWATALSAVPFQEALSMANRQQIQAIFITNDSAPFAITYSDAYRQAFGK